MVQLGLVEPLMQPLDHVASVVNNTTANPWVRRVSFSRPGAAGPLLHHNALLRRRQNIALSLSYYPGNSNVMADDSYRCFQLTDTEFLCYFNATYPQPLSCMFL